MADLRASARLRFYDAIDYWIAPVWILGIALWYWNGLDVAWACQYVAAYAAWTLLEYWLHRGVFHNYASGPIWKGHMHHHRDPHAIQPLRLLTPVLTGILFVAALAVPVVAPWVQGLIAGYWAYLLIHWAIHEYEYQTSLGKKWWAAGPYLRHIQRLHDRHHHANSGKWFGLHTMAWDHVFRTAEPVYIADTPLLRPTEKRKGSQLEQIALEARENFERMDATMWGGRLPLEDDQKPARAPAAPGRNLRGRLAPPRWNDK